MKKKLADTAVPVVVRLPKNVIAALDSAAIQNYRSRSSEIRSRLQQSLVREVRA